MKGRRRKKRSSNAIFIAIILSSSPFFSLAYYRREDTDCSSKRKRQMTLRFFLLRSLYFFFRVLSSLTGERCKEWRENKTNTVKHFHSSVKQMSVNVRRKSFSTYMIQTREIFSKINHRYSRKKFFSLSQSMINLTPL